MMNRERLIQTFTELVSIDAPTFGERQMADELRKRLEELGFTVEEDGAGEVYGGTAGNLYAFRRGTLEGRPLLFSTHMDTVEPALGKRAVVHADGRITSGGDTVLGADCMAGTAALLEALTELREEGADCRDLELLFFIGEEKHLRGSEVFDFSVVRAEEAFVLDLSGPVGTAANQAPTLVDFRIEVQGKSAHAGFAPETGVHAVAAAAKAVARMELGRIGGDMTVNIGSIRGGGKTTNIVPDSCVLLGEVRGASHEKALSQMQKIKALFEEEAARMGGGCRVEYTVPVHAYRTPADHPSVQRFRRACAALALSGELRETFGGSDLSNLSHHGIRGLVLASAMERVHSCREYTEIGELEKLTDLVKRMMRDAE